MSDKKTPVPVDGAPKTPEKRSASGEIDAFLRQAKAVAATRAAGGRLILALDATMSRQPTWDMACALQAEMFDAVGKAGSLGVQLVYFRGLGECQASKFVSDTAALKRLMSGISCRGGNTQIGKVLGHALKETAAGKVDALVYIGDAMEEQLRGSRRQGRQSRPARRAGLRLPGGQGPHRRKRLQGDRAAVQGRLVPLRPQFRRDAGKTACRRSRCSRPAG